MNKNGFYLLLCLLKALVLGLLIQPSGLLAASTPPNAKAAAAISAGRACVQGGSQDFARALVQFNAAVTADPSNAQVRVIRALGRVAAVSSHPACGALLDRLGYSSTGRNFLNWTAARTGDLAIDLRSKEFADLLSGPVSDALSLAEEDLAFMTARDFSMVFADADWRFGEDIAVDYGDVTMVRAFLKGALTAIRLVISQNCDVSITKLIAAMEEGRASIHGLLQAYPSLLTVQDPVKARSAVALFQSGVDSYVDALASMMARLPEVPARRHLLELDAEGRTAALALRTDLQETSRSLRDSVVVHLTDPGNPNPGDQLRINAALFAAKFATGWRPLLPTFKPGTNAAESRLVQGAFADPQLGGMVPTLSQADWVEAWADSGAHVDAALAKRFKRMPQNVAAGANTTFLVKDDGTLWGWGDNTGGRLGEPSVTVSQKLVPVRIGTASDWRCVVASYHTLALKWDGTLYAWGRNSSGQLGDGTTVNRGAPVQIGAAGEWRAVAAGGDYSVGIKKDGSLWRWGSGGGVAGDASIPMRVSTDTGWGSVAAGPRWGSTLALQNNGTLYVPLGSGMNTLPSLGAFPWAQPRFSSVAQGYNSNHALACGLDGSLWSWATSYSGNGYSQLGYWNSGGDGGYVNAVNQPARVGSDSDWLGVSAGGDHSLAVKRDGTVWTWGKPLNPKSWDTISSPSLYRGRGDVASVSMSENHAVAITRDGAVWSYGANGSGQLGDGSNLEDDRLRSVTLASGPAPALVLTAQPVDTLFAVGKPLTLSVQAVGSGTLTYQWRKDGAAIAGATGANLVIPAASASDAGSFDVLVSDSRGVSVLSNAVQARVSSIVITQQPQSQTVNDLSTNVTFSVSAAGPGTLRYQWRRDGSPINGATQASYSTTASYAGDYDVTVSDGVTSVTSDNVLLRKANSGTVLTAFSINAAYQHDTYWVSREGVLYINCVSVDSAIPNPTNFDWYRTVGGVSTKLANGPRLAIGAAQPSDAGTYSLVVSNRSGSFTLGSFDISVSPPVDVVQAGDSATWLLKQDGSLWAWGWNAYGQLGDGTQVDKPSPVRVDTTVSFASISARGTHVLGVTSGGSLYSWGLNDRGQLGNGGTANVSTPTRVGTATNWKSVAARGSWSMGLKTDGTLWTWGGNTFGQLGNGGTASVSTPTQVGTASDWVAISAGNHHAFARKSDGSWYAWGRNDFGQLGDGTTTNRAVPVPLSTTLTADWLEVAAGNTFTLVRKLDGSLWAVGDNRQGQFGNGNFNSSTSFVRAGLWYGQQSNGVNAGGISVLDSTVMEIENGWGGIHTWGSNAYHQVDDGGGMTTTYPAGTVYPWNPQGGGGFVSISAGVNHTVALAYDGSIFAWGRNNRGQIGDGTTISSVRNGYGARIRFSATKQAQSITFPAPAYKTQGAAPFALGATSSSGLPVSYRVVSGTEILSVSPSGSVSRIPGRFGTAVVAASQAGNSDYSAAPEVTRTITVLKNGATPPTDLNSTATDRMNAGRLAFLRHDLNGAIAAFNAAQVADPNNARARVLRAVATAFSLVQGPKMQTLLDRAGIAPGGRDLWNWRSNASNNFAPGFNTSEGSDYLVNTVIPALNSMIGDLATADASFLMDLPDTEWQLGQDYVMDYADTLIMRALAKGAIAAIYLGTTSNLDLDVSALLQSSINTLQGLLAANPNLLTTKDATRAQSAVDALREGVNLLDMALAQVALRSPYLSARVFATLPEDVPDMTNLVQQMRVALAAYDSNAVLAVNASGSVVRVDTAPAGTIAPTAARANPKALYNALTSGLRSYVPAYSGNFPVQGTSTGLLGNPQIGGAFVRPDVTAGRWANVLENAGGQLSEFFAKRGKFSPRFAFTKSFGGSVALTSGAPLSLQATAVQSPDYRGVPLTYQWFKDGAPLRIAENAADGGSTSYSVAAVGASDAGDYALRATDVFGHEAWAGPLSVSVTSGVTTSAPTTALNPGESANLTVRPAVGSTYQWRKNGQDISGATSASYSATAQPTDAYSVVVTDGNGAVSIYPFFLNVNSPVTFTAQPSSVNVNQGGSLTFSAAASGTGPITYQWRKDGVILSNGTSSTYTVTNAGTANAGTYSLTATNAVGSVTSAAAVLSVNTPVVINDPARNLSANPGSSVTLSVSVGGTGPFSYQWRKNGSDILGAAFSTLRLGSLSASDAAVYTVAVSNAVNTVVSNPTTLALNSPVTVSSQPAGGAFTVGATVPPLSVSVSGTPPFTYQWRKDGVAIAGGTSSTLSLGAAAEATAGVYDVQVSNPVGAVTSGTATVVVNVPASIVRNPSGFRGQQGGTASLTVVGKGTGPLSYQWSKNGSPVTGETSASLTLSPLTSLSAGSYTVVVSNSWGSATSSAAVVAVESSAAGIPILQQPVDVTMIKGSSVYETVRIAPADSNTAYTVCQLYTASASGAAAQALSAIAPVQVDGSVNFNLRTVPVSGDYVLRFTRQLNDGSSMTADSQPFHVSVRTWDDATGSYEALLEDVNGLVGDEATYRGLLTVSVTRTGYLSGRVLYVEAQSLLNGGTLGYRAYVPVILNFTGSLAPVAGQPLRFVCSPRLGVGAQAGRQELSLELDFAADPVAITATVRDHASVPVATSADGCVSQAISARRLPAQLPTELADLTGRYVLSADAPASGALLDDNGYVLVQVLRTGKAVWTTRLAGYSGSGSATVNAAVPTSPVLQFFEGRLSVSTTQLSSSVLAGRMNFARGGDSSWGAFFGSESLPGRIEKQYSLVAGGRTPVYSGTLFSSGSNYTGVKLLSFSDGDGVRWAGATQSVLPSFLSGGKAMVLTVRDPAVDASGLSASYSWNVLLSATGAVSVSGIPRAGVTPPVLSLRLDRVRGEWTGSYSTGPSQRRNLAGAGLNYGSNSYLLGRGWAELGAGVSLSTGAWTLELAP